MLGEHHEVLTAVAHAFRDRTIVVIGAAALRWHYPSFRGTFDLDLCIAIDLAEHERAQGLPPTWRRTRGMPHRWQTETGDLVDILPAADDLLAAGRVAWPDGTVMDLTGIDLSMRDHHRCAEDLPEHVRVATRRALFVAKVTSWLDRPVERQKDLADLAFLLDDYADLDDPRRFDEPGLESIDWSNRPAFLLGSDLRVRCSEGQLAVLREFVRRIGNSDAREHHWMLQVAPPGWRADESVLDTRLAALIAGLASAR